MEEKKYLGMSKNVCLGLCYLIPVLGLITFFAEQDKLDTEEKKLFAATILIFVAEFIPIINFIAVIFAIIAAVSYFQGDFSYEAILFYDIAEKFIKDPPVTQNSSDVNQGFSDSSQAFSDDSQDPPDDSQNPPDDQ